MSRPVTFTAEQIARMRALRAAKGSLGAILGVLRAEGISVSKSRLAELVGDVLPPGRNGWVGADVLSGNRRPVAKVSGKPTAPTKPSANPIEVCARALVALRPDDLAEAIRLAPEYSSTLAWADVGRAIATTLDACASAQLSGVPAPDDDYEIVDDDDEAEVTPWAAR